MSRLPKTDLPIYTLKLPSDGSEMKFRPYTVKERKILLMALEGSNDDTAIVDSIKQIISNCVISPENFDIGLLASFDLEYVFINLRARSIGESISLEYVCKNELPDLSAERLKVEVCNHTIKFDVNLLEVSPKTTPGHSPTIAFNPTSGVKMKYPTIDMANKVGGSSVDLAFDYIVGCIEYVYTADEIIKSTEVTKEELIEFVESLTIENFNKIEKFFTDSPNIRETVEKDCPKCNHHHTIVLEGLLSFFV